jgi:hypothetical protein
MTQVVEPDAAKTGLLDELREPLREPLRADRVTTGLREDEAVIAVRRTQGLLGRLMIQVVGH